MSSGIYRITCVETGRFYIGQSRQLEKRWPGHLNRLRTSRHPNRFLQHVFDKYGEDSLTFEVTLYCGIDELDQTEQSLLDQYLGTDLCMNIAPDAQNPVANLERHDDWCRRISEARKGQRLTEATKQKLREARANQVFSPESFKRGGDKRRGIKRPAEIGAKISAALTGKKLSQEHIKALQDSHRFPIMATHADGTVLEFDSARPASEYFLCTKGAILANVKTGHPGARGKLKGWTFTKGLICQ